MGVGLDRTPNRVATSAGFLRVNFRLLRVYMAAGGG